MEQEQEKAEAEGQEEEMKYLVLLLLVAGCKPPSADELKWRHVKSPLSGRCYELAPYALGTNIGVMGMSEIPCSEAHLDAEVD